MAVAIRPVRPEEAEQVLAVLHAAHAWNLANGFNFTAADMPLEALVPRLVPASFFVAEGAEGLVGTIEVKPDARGDWWFHLLAVAPGLAGGGVGRSLVAYAEAHAAGQGARRLALDTPESHPWLPAFYGRLGYVAYGTAQWEGKRYRSVLMAKDLFTSRTPPRSPS